MTGFVSIESGRMHSVVGLWVVDAARKLVVDSARKLVVDSAKLAQCFEPSSLIDALN